MLTENEKILALINDICPVCGDFREYCPASSGKHGRGSWREGDALHTLREKLVGKPYVGRHRRGRHAA